VRERANAQDETSKDRVTGTGRTLGNRIVTRILQRYWRLSRGLQLAACGVARDAGGRVALVRPRNEANWRLPGCLTARGETAEGALGRALSDAGIEMVGPARLFAIYAAPEDRASTHIALYLVPSWRLAAAERRDDLEFFDVPPAGADLDASVGARLDDIVAGRARSELW